MRRKQKTVREPTEWKDRAGMRALRRLFSGEGTGRGGIPFDRIIGCDSFKSLWTYNDFA
jgi:hypothetical protein